MPKVKKDKEIGMVMRQGCRFGDEWLPRIAGKKPRVCPECKTPNWDRTKQFKRKA